MKTIFFSGIFLLLSLNLPAQFPSVYLEDTDNREIRVEELKGSKLTIVDFWATWCKPCLLAIPELSKIQEEFKSLGVEVIGVNIDSPRNFSKIRPFMDARGINYPVLLDKDQELMREMNIVSLPSLIIFNEEGKQLYFHEGFKSGDELMIRAKITELLN